MTQTHLETSCPSCATSYTVELDLIPSGGAKATCRVCKGTLILRRPKTPTVWIFTDDPAMQRTQTLAMIKASTGFDFLMLDAEEREALQDLPTFPIPSAVVFGDMHVLLEDEMLLRCCKAGAGRILLSTHENDDLRETAGNFCGFDHHVMLPIEPALMCTVLEDATNLSAQ